MSLNIYHPTSSEALYSYPDCFYTFMESILKKVENVIKTQKTIT